VIGSHWDGKGISGGNCYGVRKKARFVQWFEEQGFEEQQGFEPEQIYIRFVSDSFADAPLLDYADEAIFNTASASAKARAEAKGWRVCDLRH
jgi:phosphoserine phosphatase